jgi:hypothetical protein
MPASRSVVSTLLRELGDFSLHPQGRPCGRPPAAAVLGRQRHDGHRGTGLTLPPGEAKAPPYATSEITDADCEGWIERRSALVAVVVVGRVRRGPAGRAVQPPPPSERVSSIHPMGVLAVRCRRSMMTSAWRTLGGSGRARRTR